MRYLKTRMIVAASVLLAVLLGLAGCGDDHGHRIRDDRNRSVHRDGR